MKICVHDGVFHADESFSVFLLKCLDEYATADVVRTRNAEIIDSCDIVCDVGGVYDHEKKRYDHHQTSFTERYPGSPIPMASAGLIYLHYGEQAIKNILIKNGRDPENHIDFIKAYMYENFVKEIDAIDNGVAMVPGVEPAYKIDTGISSRVARLVPKNSTMEKMDEKFSDAVKLVGDDFEFMLLYCYDREVPGIEVTQKAYDSRFDVDPSGRIIVLEEDVRAKNHLKILEQGKEEVFFIVYPRPDNWAVKVVETTGFHQRCPLPKNCAGLRDEELTQACGIPGGVFCHKSCFLGVFHTKEACIKFALMGIAMQEEEAK